MSYIAIFTTTPNEQLAQKITDALLEKNFTACISFCKIRSNYKWNGSIQKEDEIELYIKTEKRFYKKIKKVIKSIHTYETPQIIAFDISYGSKSYLKWIDKALKGK